MSVRPGNISENDEVHFSLWGSLLPWDDEQTLARGLGWKANISLTPELDCRKSSAHQRVNKNAPQKMIRGAFRGHSCSSSVGSFWV